MIYSIIIYYSTPLGWVENGKNMASFSRSNESWHVIIGSIRWFIITVRVDWNVWNFIVMKNCPTEAHYSIRDFVSVSHEQRVNKINETFNRALDSPNKSNL